MLIPLGQCTGVRSWRHCWMTNALSANSVLTCSSQESQYSRMRVNAPICGETCCQRAHGWAREALGCTPSSLSFAAVDCNLCTSCYCYYYYYHHNLLLLLCDAADLFPSLQDAVSARAFSAFDHSQEDGFDIVRIPLAHCKVLILLIAGGFQFKFFINIPS